MILKVDNGSIIFTNGDNCFKLFKSTDGDICFTSNISNIVQTISSKSEDRGELQPYEIFSNLIRRIIGDFVLKGDEENASLPQDFVDLQSKIITLHSDSEPDNVLEMLYEDKSIIVSVTKDKTAGDNVNNSVRIRTDGSQYEYYYHFFVEFYTELMQLANAIQQQELQVSPKAEVLQGVQGTTDKPKKRKKSGGFILKYDPILIAKVDKAMREGAQACDRRRMASRYLSEYRLIL